MIRRKPQLFADLDGTVEGLRRAEGEDQANYSGTHSTPAIHEDLGRIFIGIGGNNYDNVQAGIDCATTPFLRAMDWQTLDDAWEMDNSDPGLYVHAQPPMYRTPGESGLSSPAVVNDVVFFSTSKIALYAFDAWSGKRLWEDQLGEQKGGLNGRVWILPLAGCLERFRRSRGARIRKAWWGTADLYTARTRQPRVR